MADDCSLRIGTTGPSIVRVETAITVSTPDQLKNDALVATVAAPVHTPNRPTQTCMDKLLGTVYQWYGGTWTHE